MISIKYFFINGFDKKNLNMHNGFCIDQISFNEALKRFKRDRKKPY